MDEIFRIANQLAANGQPPSTALVKARLRQPVPMATLITAIQRWKQDPEAYKSLGFPGTADAESSAAPQPASPEDQLEMLQRQVEQLQQQVTMLAKRVSLLEQLG
ncbi:conserved hypothetical protein [Tolumonas auensis DSM 9187]|uniref:KfrA N-terminal DNA-binding domain-containing protein n=1 Tax=Tolumonas auensis (strain DSM 9187 / NBRC 110442 / TA 4) TaxID=595494 RepID=C4L9Z5_TOLAT|nr:hypothetical protein [Tolumonas auensis]ACQ92124.1 conserved hypothetical protein [Tolumonas auensis DSM 9187]